MRDLRAALEQRRQQHLYRKPRIASGAQQPEMIVDGKPMLSFCSNDYLGLAADDRVRQAFKKGIDQYGAGSGSAHLVTGHGVAHQALEEEIADFTGRDRVLLFSSGYMANLAVVRALAGKGDSVVGDKLNHASLIDAGLSSGAKFSRYTHNDMAAAEQRLINGQGEKLLVTDGVFSMDGDLANLPALAKLSAEYEAWLMVDDAHGIGVLGSEGGGSLSHYGLTQQQVPVLMGTLGKAFGTAGAFVAGSEELIETLIQQAKTYIYTTALPAAMAEATRESLRLVIRDNWRREKLKFLISSFRQAAKELGLAIGTSETPIQPLIAGSAARAVEWSSLLEQQNILVTPIRPPTVPEGTARLRITFSALHTEAHLEKLLQALACLS